MVIVPVLIGRAPDRIEDRWQMLFRGAYWRGGLVLMTALAGIDTGGSGILKAPRIQ